MWFLLKVTEISEGEVSPVLDNYSEIEKILTNFKKLCYYEDPRTGYRRPRKQEQRLLRNLGLHKVVVEFIKIPYQKVRRLKN